MRFFKSILVSCLVLSLFSASKIEVNATEPKLNTVNSGFSMYLKSIEISPIETPEYQGYEIPENDGFKSYMTYRLFSKNSTQYALQTICTTDSDGFRKVDDCYVIALGSYFEYEIGQRVDLVLENEETIHCVIGDAKDDKDTDAANLFTVANNCMSEFIVDPKLLETTVKSQGDASFLPGHNWDSPVCYVKIYDDNVLKRT